MHRFKNYIRAVLLLLIGNNLSCQNVQATDCPLEGNAQTEHLKELNKLKNRSSFPEAKDFNHKITLSEILKKGDDKERWNHNYAAKVIGYVRDVKTALI